MPRIPSALPLVPLLTGPLRMPRMASRPVATSDGVHVIMELPLLQCPALMADYPVVPLRAALPLETFPRPMTKFPGRNRPVMLGALQEPWLWNQDLHVRAAAETPCVRCKKRPVMLFSLDEMAGPAVRTTPTIPRYSQRTRQPRVRRCHPAQCTASSRLAVVSGTPYSRCSKATRTRVCLCLRATFPQRRCP